MSDALFEPAGAGRWTPTDLSRGPWDDRYCHGGPVGALLTRAVEDIDDDPEWHLARLSIELLRPVAVGHPLSVRTEIERPGRKVSLVAAHLTLDDAPADGGDDGTEVARVRALRMRRRTDPLPAGTVHAADAPPGHPETSATTPADWRSEWGLPRGRAFHTEGSEHRYISGSVREPGPVEVWIRLTVPVVPAEEPSPTQRVVAAADFGNGVSAGIAADGYSYINPDLTIHLARPPVGAWVGMRSVTNYGDGVSSVGYAESALYDVEGRIGRSVQSLLIGRAG